MKRESHRLLELAEHAHQGKVPVKHLHPLLAELSTRTTQETSLPPLFSGSTIVNGG